MAHKPIAIPDFDLSHLLSDDIASMAAYAAAAGMDTQCGASTDAVRPPFTNRGVNSNSESYTTSAVTALLEPLETSKTHTNQHLIKNHNAKTEFLTNSDLYIQPVSLSSVSNSDSQFSSSLSSLSDPSESTLDRSVKQLINDHRSKSGLSFNPKLFVRPTVLDVSRNKFEVNFDWFQGSVFLPKSDLDLEDDYDPSLTFCAFFDEELKSIFPNLSVVSGLPPLNKCYLANNSYYDKPFITKDSIKCATRICSLEYGGNAGYHLTSTGFYSRLCAPFFQSLPFRLSRADVAIDCFEPIQEHLFFDSLVAIFADYFKEKNMVGRPAGDWLNGNGRSMYFGSASSPLMVVIYEKGIESHNSDDDDDDDDTAPIFPYWTRIEFRFRPKKEQRLEFARLTPMELLQLGFCPDLLNLIDFNLVKSGSVHSVRKPTKHEKSLAYMFQQYANTMTTEIKNSSFSDFSLKILKKLFQQQKITSSEFFAWSGHATFDENLNFATETEILDLKSKIKLSIA